MSVGIKIMGGDKESVEQVSDIILKILMVGNVDEATKQKALDLLMDAYQMVGALNKER